jgi:hypothetical protein
VVKGGDSKLSLPARFPRKVALADRDALPSEDVVCGCSVEVKVGLGERQQEILRGVIDMAVAKGEAHIAAKERIDLGGFDRFKCGDGLNNSRLECSEILWWCRRIGREDSLADAFDGPERVHYGRFHLVGKRVHIGGEAGFEDVLWRQPFLGAKGFRLVD